MFYTEEIFAEEASALLSACGLTVPLGIDYTVGVFADDGRLAATGSIKGDMIQGVAVAPEFQGEDLTAKVLTDLISHAESDSLYLFTKPEKAPQFAGLGFRPVATASPYAAMLEWGAKGIEEYTDYLTAHRFGSEDDEAAFGARSAALVMNCNPFTIGHRYLIEQAASRAKHVYLLVVEEERSLFSFKERFDMVRLGTEDMPNVTVLPGGRYAVSSLTFPSYFTKEENFAAAHAAMDAELFAACIAPALGVTVRFVGNEPNEQVTAVYNQALAERLPKHGIELREIPRLRRGNDAVSASRVRALLAELFASPGAGGAGADRFDICDELSELLPPAVLSYIMQPAVESRLCIASEHGDKLWR